MGLGWGCGVTAYTEEDALFLVKETYFQKKALPAVQHIIADVDISTLDQDHVAPNMGSTVWRGVWWPRQSNQP